MENLRRKPGCSHCICGLCSSMYSFCWHEDAKIRHRSSFNKLPGCTIQTTHFVPYLLSLNKNIPIFDCSHKKLINLSSGRWVWWLWTWLWEGRIMWGWVPIRAETIHHCIDTSINKLGYHIAIWPQKKQTIHRRYYPHYFYSLLLNLRNNTWNSCQCWGRSGHAWVIVSFWSQ